MGDFDIVAVGLNSFWVNTQNHDRMLQSLLAPPALASPELSHEGEDEDGEAMGELGEHADDAMGTVEDIVVDDDDALVVSPPQTHVRIYLCFGWS